MRTVDKPLRSLLFVPSDSERKLAKAGVSGADVVIFDLEDAVAQDSKTRARTMLRAHLASRPGYRFAVRVNGADTQDHYRDLAEVVPFSPEFIVLPKCAGAEDVRLLDAALNALEHAFEMDAGAIGILPLATETAQAASAMDYRDAGSRLIAIAFAGEDLAADLGIIGRDRDGVLNPMLAHVQRKTALSASAAGVLCIDTPFPDHRNDDGLRAEAQAARSLGFCGKLLIHPGQVEIVNALFQPTGEQLAWAEAVDNALSASASGVGVVAGKMVDKAHLKLARRILANRP